MMEFNVIEKFVSIDGEALQQDLCRYSYVLPIVI